MNEDCGPGIKGSNSLLNALLRAAHRIEAHIESALADGGLSLAKLSVLDHLVQGGEPLPLGQLAGRISCVKSNMTQLIDRLETDGLVARVADPEDRRSVRAAITDEGRRRHAAGVRILVEQEQELLKGFKAAERKQLTELLGQIKR